MSRNPLGFVLFSALAFACNGDLRIGGEDDTGSAATSSGAGADSFNSPDGSEGTDGSDGSDGGSSGLEIYDGGVDNDGDLLGDCADTDWTADAAYACVAVQLDGSFVQVATGHTAACASTYERGADPACGSLEGTGGDAMRVWSSPVDACVTFDTFGSKADTILRVFTGCGDTETICNGDVSNADADGSFQSRITTQAQAGAVPCVVVDAFCPEKDGAFVFNTNERDPVFAGARTGDLADATGSAVATGSNAIATEAVELGCGYGVSGAFAYTCTPSATGTYVITTAGSSFDTVLGVSSGVGCEADHCNDDGGDEQSASLVMEAEMGITYPLILGGFNGSTGGCVLNING